MIGILYYVVGAIVAISAVTFALEMESRRGLRNRRKTVLR